MARRVSRRPGGRSGRHTRSIIDHTLRLLEERGYAALTLNDVALAAGVSRSTLYRRWPSRAELVLQAIGQSLIESVQPSDTGAFVSDLRETLRQIADYLSTPLGGAAIGASIEIGASAMELRHAIWTARLAEFAPIFERAIARGELAADFDQEAALAATSGALYFRKILSAQPIDALWIDRVIAMWKGHLAP